MFDRNLTLSKADPDVWAAVQKKTCARNSTSS